MPVPQLPSARENPIVTDPETGWMSFARSWFLFFQQTQQFLAGSGSTGTFTDEDLFAVVQRSPEEFFEALTLAMSQVDAQRAQIAEIQAQQVELTRQINDLRLGTVVL